jgi:hypothetical protein
MTQRPRIPGEGIAVHFLPDGPTTCHACARVRAGSAQALESEFDSYDGAEVGACEVDAWNLDDLDAGEALTCDACGVVLYRRPAPDLYRLRFDGERPIVEVRPDGAVVWSVLDVVFADDDLDAAHDHAESLGYVHAEED